MRQQTTGALKDSTKTCWLGAAIVTTHFPLFFAVSQAACRRTGHAAEQMSKAKKGTDGRFFAATNAKGEVSELKADLNSTNKDKAMIVSFSSPLVSLLFLVCCHCLLLSADWFFVGGLWCM